MIKQLITDIAFDTIKLSQGLTRAKLIENKIKNETFKKWLNKELEGYEFEDDYLPSYRKVWSTISLTAELPFGRTETFPISLPESFGEKALDVMNHHRIVEPISIIEYQIETLDKAIGYINLYAHQVNLLANLYKDQIAQYRGVIKYGSREIGKVQYQNVLEQTKQKLLDTLMQLDNEFPNLTDEYTMNMENNEKVQNIVTNNIYGSNNPMNIATGVNVEVNVTNNTITKEDEAKLKTLGVSEDEITEIKKIISENSTHKPTLTSKAMKWLGSVTASAAGRGLYENIPQITEFVEKLIQ